MVENRSSIVSIIAIIIGASGLGLGAFSIVNLQVAEGPQGPPGEDISGGIIVGIMDPDEGEVVSGIVTIRAMIAGSEDYTVSILRNGTEIGTSLPMTWNTETVTDGWWSITIIATDIATNNQSQDEVVVYVQNIEDPTNIYYCSSQSEIEDALDTFGTGHGTIIITEDIILTSQINIDDGGRYIIQGAGPIIIDRNANDEAFSVTNVQSLILRDLIIDTSDINSSAMQGIYVNEGNNNIVCIQNVQIHGGNGQGIFVDSENVWIENCIIYDVSEGIHLADGSAYCYVIGNSLFDISHDIVNVYGIYNSNYNIISGNIIHNISSSIGVAGGILSSGDDNIISGNFVYDIDSGSSVGFGMDLYGTGNTISDNVVYNIGSPSTRGISISGYDNTISDNVLYDINGVSDVYGIRLRDTFYNSFSGNRVYNIIATSGVASGIYIYYWEVPNPRYNTFTGNSISNIQASSNYGISGTYDYTVIVGNTFIYCGTAIGGGGSGNEIANNVI